jgi:hypothetical protein
MPVTAIDWSEVKAMHVKGVPLKALAAEFGIEYGTLRVRASREKWRNSCNKADALVMQSVTSHLEQFADRHLRKMVGLADKGVDLLVAEMEANPSRKALGEIVAIADTLDRMARRTAKLDENPLNKPASLTINVNTASAIQAVPLGQVIEAELVSEQPAQLADAQPADEPQAQATKRKRVR